MSKSSAAANDQESVKRSVVHATFTIERTFKFPPARVFAAWAQPELKARWFKAPPDKSTETRRKQDFRVGGSEQLSAAWTGSYTSHFDAYYLDIVPNERIIYAYHMHLDDKHISASLATVQFKAEGSGTRLILTEQGAFLDGYDDSGSREKGTAGLMDKLAAELEKS